MIKDAIKDIDGNYFPKECAGAELPCATLLHRLRKEEDSQKCFDMLYLTQNLRGAYFTKFLPHTFSPTENDIEVLSKCEDILKKYNWDDILTEENAGTKCQVMLVDGEIIPIEITQTGDV